MFACAYCTSGKRCFVHGACVVLCCANTASCTFPPPRNSPFVVHNNFGGGFVSDGDSVALNSVKFASVRSSGADGGGSEMDSQHMAHLSMDSQVRRSCLLYWIMCRIHSGRKEQHLDSALHARVLAAPGPAARP